MVNDLQRRSSFLTYDEPTFEERCDLIATQLSHLQDQYSTDTQDLEYALQDKENAEAALLTVMQLFADAATRLNGTVTRSKNTFSVTLDNSTFSYEFPFNVQFTR